MCWFYSGVAALSLLFGFLVGASHTPVAGVAITATFGLLAGVFAFHQKATLERTLGPKQNLMKQLDQLKPRITDALGVLGRVLVVFSLAFGVGLTWGIYLKITEPIGVSKSAATFPWEGSTEPRSTRAAIDWILVQEKLRVIGYNDKQIRALYEADRKSKSNATRFGLEDELLSPLFSKIEVDRRLHIEKEHYIADIPDLMKKHMDGVNG